MMEKMVRENCISFQYNIKIDTHTNIDFEMSNDSVLSSYRHSQDSVLNFIFLDRPYLNVSLGI